jgi:hypothetical protein
VDRRSHAVVVRVTLHAESETRTPASACAPSGGAAAALFTRAVADDAAGPITVAFTLTEDEVPWR